MRIYGRVIQNSGPRRYVLAQGMTVRNSRVQGASFDPEITGLLGRAYDRACEKIAPDKTLREALAKRIIKAAMHGERHLEKLIEYGLGEDDLATLRKPLRPLSEDHAKNQVLETNASSH